jgi:plasmid stability protein
VTNLTIAVDEEILKQARIRAIEEGTSVNAVLRERLAEYAGASKDRVRVGLEILAAAKRSRMRSGGRKWTREEIYDRGRPR